ncbi:MAG: hypothetical protein ACI814_005327, partial [Mariniblastus sp.]
MTRNHLRSSLLSTLVLLACFVSGPSVFAQQDVLEALQPSLNKIDQGTVTSTVTFLASDAMKGRDTPSAELTIASHYVAARFRGAGLKSMVDDGSYFQTHEIATTSIASEGIVATRDGKAMEHFGMLSANSEPMSYVGEITMVTGETPKDQKFTGPVSVVIEKFGSRRDQSNAMRTMARLRQNGATAILVQVAPDHRLVQQAGNASKPRMVNPRGGAAGHVLLIAKQNVGGEIALELPQQSTSSATVYNVMGMLPGSDPELS